MSQYAYCSLADVEGQTGFKYDAESQPSRTEARNTISGVAAEIDGVLEAAGYDVPVPTSATRALTMLKFYNTIGAAYRLWHSDVRGPETFPAAQSWELDFRTFLENLAAGKMKLPGLADDDASFTAKLRSVKVTGNG